jgi:hypothetical protein
MSGFDRADLDDGRQLDQLRFVLVRVVLAEEQFTAGRKLGPYAGSGAAAIAAVSPGQFWTGKHCGHGFSLPLRLRLVFR